MYWRPVILQAGQQLQQLVATQQLHVEQNIPLHGCSTLILGILLIADVHYNVAVCKFSLTQLHVVARVPTGVDVDGQPLLVVSS